MSLQRLYRTSRPARWVCDALIVLAMVGTIAALHTLPSLGILSNDVLGRL